MSSQTKDYTMDRDPAVKQIAKVLQRATELKLDPEVVEGLQTALKYVGMRDDYTVGCTSGASAECEAIIKETMRHPWTQLKEEGKTLWNLRPRMMSGNLEGQFLKSLLSANGARRVLDVGTYTGYSALSMAEALPADGQLVTLEVDPYLKQHDQPFFDASPHGHKITMKIGPALQTMREMVKAGEKFDFMFVDADKSDYIECFKIAIDEGLLAPNGTIAADNAFMGGRSYLSGEGSDNPCRAFGEYVSQHKGLHKVLVPIRDGILIIRRLSDVERDPRQK